MNRESHAVGYANSLVGYFTAEEELRRGKKAVKHFAKMGLITFPEPEVKIQRAKPFNARREDEKRSIVSAIHALRREGNKARCAAAALDISYKTYSRWAVNLNMPYVGQDGRGKWRNFSTV